MFLINISLKEHLADEETAASRFEQHSQWFSKHFQEGRFLMLGPYQDKHHAGVIIAQAESRVALERVLSEDIYYPLGLADYEIREFKAALISGDIKNYEGK
ncbi:YciI family protein [Dickeya dadantii]|uniref:YciI family protein n=1 Tax=Dickeya dadantii TaxID=204038 RepID=UPI0021DAEA2B|nr:YciI family protein [Dickeya dadantii]